MNIQSNNLKVEATPGGMNIQIKKDAKFNAFQLYALSLLVVAHVFCVLFIFNSIFKDGMLEMKVIFTIVGVFMLWIVNTQLREILIFVKGDETLKIDEKALHYMGTFGIAKKSLSIKLNQIKKLDLMPLGKNKFSKFSSIATQMKYGVILIEKSKRKKITFGQSLEKQELEKLYSEIKKKIKQPTMAMNS